MRITILTLLVTISTLASAADEKLKKIYIGFESVYMNNDADGFLALLDKSYEIKQTLHIPGVGADYRPVTKEQLIASMRRVGKPSSFPRSKMLDVTIEIKSENDFCGSSSTLKQTKVRGKDYEEKENRKVCFRKEGDKYLAVEHTIDVYFTEM